MNRIMMSDVTSHYCVFIPLHSSRCIPLALCHYQAKNVIGLLAS